MQKAILIFLLSMSLSFAEQLLPFPFIYVEGEADTSVIPSIATIHFLIVDINPESSTAVENVEKISADVVAILDSNGIISQDIKAFNITKNIKQDYNNNEMKILGYECSRGFEVKINDLNVYDEIAKQLLLLDNLDRYRVEFTVNDRTKLDSALIMQACKNARETAILLAGSQNAKVGNLYAISKSEFYLMPAKFGLDDKYRGRGSQTSSHIKTMTFVPQTIDINSKINAIFRIR